MSTVERRLRFCPAVPSAPELHSERATPNLDPRPQTLVFHWVKAEGVRGKPLEGMQSVQEKAQVEAEVLLGRQREQPPPTELIDQRSKVDKVTSRGTSEHSQRLIRRKLLGSQHVRPAETLRWHYPRVIAKVYLTNIGPIADLETHKSVLCGSGRN